MTFVAFRGKIKRIICIAPSMTFCHKPYPIDKGKEDSAMNEFKGSSKYVVSEDLLRIVL